MKLLNDIKSIIEGPIDQPFLYESFYGLNEWVAHTNLPCVGLQRIENGTFVNEGGQIKDSSDFLIFFLDQTTFNPTDLENQAIIDTCKETAIDFIREVELSDGLVIVGDPTFEYVYQRFDITVTGIALSIRLKERGGEIPCNRVFSKSFSRIFN